MPTSAFSFNKRRKLIPGDPFYHTEGTQWTNKNVVVGSSKKKIRNCKDHLDRRQTRRIGDEGEDVLADTCDSRTLHVIKEKSMMDQELKLVDVAQMIIKHGVTSLKSIKAEILHVYKEEKKKLSRYFSELSCFYSLTIDSLQRTSDGGKYCCLTVHFIDNSWELKKKIIGFKYLEGGRDFLETCKSLLLDWNIDRSVIAVQLNTVEGDGIKSWLRHQPTINQTPFYLVDKFSYMRSLVDFLEAANYLAVVVAHDVVLKIKHTLDYIRETSANEHKFRIAVNKAKSLGKKVTSQGVPSVAISIFQDLKSALGFREAFGELEKIDRDFKSRKLTKKEWEKATALYEFFNVSNDASRIINENRYVNPIVYFSKVCELYKKFDILSRRHSRDYCLTLAFAARDFHENWDDFISVLEIAVILDPRFKVEVVESWYKKIYELDAHAIASNIWAKINKVFKKYVKRSGILESSTSLFGDANSSGKMLDHRLGRPCTSSVGVNAVESHICELSEYLGDPKLPFTEEFDLLTWWRVNTPKYPILARMARDFLAVYFSTIVSDSFFQDEFGDVICSSDLDSDMIEAFICTRSWMDSPKIT